MDDEKFDLNSRIWVWFNSVLSYDNIIAHDFLNEIDGCATFADVIIGLADRCPLSDFLGDTLIGSSSLLSKIADLCDVDLDTALGLWEYASGEDIDQFDKEGILHMIDAANTVSLRESYQISSGAPILLLSMPSMSSVAIATPSTMTSRPFGAMPPNCSQPARSSWRSYRRTSFFKRSTGRFRRRIGFVSDPSIPRIRIHVVTSRLVALVHLATLVLPSPERPLPISRSEAMPRTAQLT